MKDRVLELRTSLSATPAEVFAAWTEPALLESWLAPHAMLVHAAEVDARRGGRYRIDLQEPNGEMHTVIGAYREWQPNARLVLSWTWQGPPAQRETLLTVELRPLGGGTELRLLHEGLELDDSFELHAKCWPSCLDKLEALLRRRQG